MMAIYRVQGPDGHVYRVEGPEGASDEQVIAALRGQVQAKQTTQHDQITRPLGTRGGIMRSRVETPTQRNYRLHGERGEGNYSPLEGNWRDVAAGAGQSVYETGRGIGQLAGAYTPEEIDRQRTLDRPLLESGAGKSGAILGTAAQFIGPGAIARAGSGVAAGAGALRTAGALDRTARAFLPTSRAGAATQGAVIGGAQPVGSNDSRMLNAGLGAAAGYGGARIGESLGALGRPAAPIIPQERATALRTASEAGYVLPPSEIRQGGIMGALEGLTGKIQAGQAASSKNQKVTNRLAREALGIPDDVPLNEQTLGAIRSQAGRAYDSISSVGQIVADKKYSAELQAIAKKYDTAAQAFPAANRPTITNAVQGLDVQQFDAAGGVQQIRLLRDYADTAFRQGDKGMGKAYQEAAGALEGLIERNLQAQGLGDMLGAFRDARQTIAKTYTVQKALNGTGDVSAQTLAAELRKGKPLSGGLRKAAEVGRAFPKATQALKDPYRSLSALDYLFGGAGAMSNPMALAAVGARPAARASFLSGSAQKAMARKALTGRAFLPQVVPDRNREQLELLQALIGPTSSVTASR